MVRLVRVLLSVVLPATFFVLFPEAKVWLVEYWSWYPVTPEDFFHVMAAFFEEEFFAPERLVPVRRTVFTPL